MPQLLSIGDLRVRCRERADMPNPDKFVNDDELGRYIQKSWERLYNKLVGQYEDYFVKHSDEGWVRRYPDTGTAGLLAGHADYSWPADFAKLIRFALGDGTRNRAIEQEIALSPLHRCTFREELWLNPNQARGRPTHYIRFGRADTGTPESGSGFRLVPQPDRAYLLDIVYVPQPPLIESIPANFVMGWDEYVVLDVVIKMRDKQESDCKLLLLERDEVLKVIESTLAPVDLNEPAHVEGAAQGLSAWDTDGGEALYD